MRTLLLICCLFISGHLFAQDFPRLTPLSEPEIQKLEHEMRSFNMSLPDSLNENYFLDSSFTTSFGLECKSDKFVRRMVWDGLMKQSNEFKMVFEFVWKFKDRAAMNKFTHKYGYLLSDEGDLMSDAGLEIPNTTIIRLFKDGNKAAKMTATLGLPPMGFYNFIMRVDNTLIKLYLQTKTGVPVEHALILAKHAAAQVYAAQKQ